VSELNLFVIGDLEQISSTFFEQLLRQYSLAKKFQSQTVIREKLRKILLYEKGAHKILMKLTPYHVSANVSSCGRG
jgi:hypothetical protein